MSRRRAATLLAGLVTLPTLAVAFVPLAATAAPIARRGPAAHSLALIDGSGSTWSANAVNQWIANVEATQSMQVVFNPTGSAAGRQDYGLATTDFGVSDIGYQGFDPVTGTNDVSKRPYAYLPITAGGTAFPYNITANGHRIINLRLSGLTLAKIFTNHIINWDDPAITADNNGRQLPNLPIITVVPSEGSGTTAQFTSYLSYMFQSLWKPFNFNQAGMTEYWPRQGTQQVAQSGSSQIINYVGSSAANGAIGVAEYSYALQNNLPVANIENSAGFYVLPTEYNDAVALTQAQINYNQNSPNYLLETLNNVYTYNDPRAYPLSSYSYTIMPVSANDPRMAVPAGQFPSKWQTLADFLKYSICQGQEYIGPIGYSALPINLVEAGFRQIDRIKHAAPQVDLTLANVRSCNNPTFIAGHPSENHLAKIAPMPPLCDKAGHGPCVGTTNGNANGGRGTNGGGPSPSSSTPGPSNSSVGPSGSPVVNPVTGQTSNSGIGPGNGSPPTPVSAILPPSQGKGNAVLIVLAIILVFAGLVVPPVLAVRLEARNGRRQ